MTQDISSAVQKDGTVKAGVSIKRTCGACKKQFCTAKLLAEHLKVCELVKVGVEMMKIWNNEKLEDE